MVAFPSVGSTLDKKINPAGAALLPGWVPALPQRLDDGIGGTHQPARRVSHPRKSASIGRWYRSIGWGPVGTTSGVHCHKRRMVSADVRYQTAATLPRQMSLALALWRPKMQDTLDVKTAYRRVGRVSPEPQWRRLFDAGHAGAAAQDQYQSMMDVGRRVGHPLTNADDLEKARAGGGSAGSSIRFRDWQGRVPDGYTTVSISAGASTPA
jgi:hypothetical protein